MLEYKNSFETLGGIFMPFITINTDYSEREEYGYTFALMSNVLQNRGAYKIEQLSKLVAGIKLSLEKELKDYMDILPLFANESHKLSLFTNCRRLLLTENKNQFITTEEIIDKIFVNDSDEMTARVLITADNNANSLEFYRELLKQDVEAVKYCLRMEIAEDLRMLLLSMLVEREEYTKRIVSFAKKTLEVLRRICINNKYAINKAYQICCNTEVLSKNLLRTGLVNEEDKIVITPVLLNPEVIYVVNLDGVKYITIGTEYDFLCMDYISYDLPTLELETIGKIFSDPTRCEIIRILKNSSSYLSELARSIGVPTNSLHYHIQMLSDLQVIVGNYKGKKFVYELNPNFFKLVSNTSLQLIYGNDKNGV